MNDIEKKTFIKSLIDSRTADDNPKPLQATITLDGQLESTGLFFPSFQKLGEGQFQPTDGSSLDTAQATQGTLRVWDKTPLLRVKGVRRCRTEMTHHYHFDYEVM